MEDLENHVKNAFSKVEASKQENVPEKPEEEVTKKASSQQLDLFGFPLEKDESFDKKALKVEKDEDSPKEVSQPSCEESFSTNNTNEKGDEPDAGDDIGETSDPHVQGTGEGEEY